MKKFAHILMTVTILISSSVLPSCANRVRSYDLDVASIDIETHFANLGPYIAAGDSTGGIATQLYSSAFQIHGQEGSTLYYTEAPSSLGTLAQAMPLDWSQLFPQNVAPFTPSRAYAFFVVSNDADGFHGSLIITNVDQNQQPPPNEQPFIFVASNDGRTNLPGSNLLLYPGEADDEMFQMELNMNGRTQLIVKSYDTSEGDLNETVQLDLYRVDQFGESFIGKLNFIPQE